MIKKYLPYILLLAAIGFYVWVKMHQGPQRSKPSNTETSANADPFDRQLRPIIYSKHARCRMDCRQIDSSEVEEILAEGKFNKAKVETSSQGTTYPLEGVTHDGQHVRIVFAPKQHNIVVVTAIDLDSEMKCDCK